MSHSPTFHLGSKMIVQAKVQLHIPCLSCIDGKWRADQLNIGQGTRWACQSCQMEFNVTRVSDGDFEVEPTGRRNTPVTVTLRSQTVPPITVKLNTWKWAHSQNDAQEEYESHEQYYYDEHTCPTNWVRDIEEIECEGDTDPHGLFEFVSVVDGHYSEENLLQ